MGFGDRVACAPLALGGGAGDCSWEAPAAGLWPPPKCGAEEVEGVRFWGRFGFGVQWE